MEFNILTPIAITVCLSASYCVASPSLLGGARALVLTHTGLGVACIAVGEFALGACFLVWAIVTSLAGMGVVAVTPPAPSDPVSPRFQEWLGGAIAIGVFGVCYRSTILALREPQEQGIGRPWDGWVPMGIALLALVLVGWFSRRKYA